MLSRARRRLFLFCSFVMGCILTALAVFGIRFSEQSAREDAWSRFSQDAASLLLYLEDQKVLSNSWLLQMEETCRMIIDVEDQGQPLMHNRLHKHERFSQLLETARTELSAQGESRIDGSGSAWQMGRLADEKKQLRDVAVAAIPQEGGMLSVVLINLGDQTKGLLIKRRLSYACIGLAAWAGLCLLIWWLIGKLLRPVQDWQNRQARFVASASHELRTPLAGMLSSLEAAQAAKGRNREHFLENALLEGQHMRRLLDNLLDLSRSAQGASPLATAPAEPDTLLMELYETYQPLAAQKGIRLCICLPESPCPKIAMNRSAAWEILEIFLSNAFSHAFPPDRSALSGAPAVTLLLESGKDGWCLKVQDNGVGIAKEDQAKAFERFYRADPARKDRSHFGLGLSIAKDLADGMGVRIALEEAPQGGCTACLFLRGARFRP